MNMNTLSNLDAARAWLDGKTVQYGKFMRPEWIDMYAYAEKPDRLPDQFCFVEYIFRLKPEPKTIAWCGPQDVPEGAMWVRHIDMPQSIRTIAQVDHEYISVNCKNCYPSYYSFEILAKHYEWSDSSRKVWRPCSKEES